MFRSLIYYWRVNLALAGAVAVTCAVITGALLVGDSVRDSLENLVLDRLGEVDAVLVAPRFVGESIAGRMTRSFPATQEVTASPAILLQGSARAAAGQSRASSVRIYGIQDSFPRFFESDLEVGEGGGQSFPGVAINAALSRELGAAPGDQVLFSLKRDSDVDAESLLGERDPEKALETVRAVVSQVLPDRGLGQFEIQPSQAVGFNAYLALEDLQEAIGQEGQVNIVVLGGVSEDEEKSFDTVLGGALGLEDYGFRIRRGDDFFILESSSFVLRPFEVEAARKAARMVNLESQLCLTYLANRLGIGERSLPYSTICALSPLPSAHLPVLYLEGRGAAPEPGDDDIYLNEWAARELDARPGDPLLLSYYEVDSGDRFLTREATFHVASVVGMKDAGLDPLLTPVYPGIQDADDMAKWDPPFPVDLDLITPRDERYWDEFGPLPKAFVSLTRARQLWAGHFGDTTSVRLAPSSGETSLEGTISRYEKTLLGQMKWSEAGFRLLHLRKDGLEAARGPTDFSGLFAGFSFFLIAAALLLVALLFRLSAEQRSSEVGLFAAFGFSRKQVLWRFLGEGSILLVVGASFGLALSLVYTWAMLAGLRTFWNDAVGTSLLSISVTPQSLLIGAFATLITAILTLWLSIRKLFRVPPHQLLSGLSGDVTSSSRGRAARVVSRFSGVLSIVILLAALVFRHELGDQISIAFFAIGSVVLVFAISTFAEKMQGLKQLPLVGGSRHPLVALALRNLGRHRARSLTSVILIALATFTILAVEANRAGTQEDFSSSDSATGGFELLGTTDLPVFQDLNSPGGRFELGVEIPAEFLAAVSFFRFRFLPGDDASCLNLYRPTRPKLLGAGADFISRGGFEFQQIVEDASPEEKKNPWLLLNRQMEGNVIPAIGDYESVRWILKLGLGRDLTISDERGNPLQLRLVGLLHSSLFQSEILISEDGFGRSFPSVSGYRYFLVDAPESATNQLQDALESQLADYGLDVTTTKDRLSRYLAVRNTYISTFQSLGGLGLILGTLGLGIVLLRNVLERRQELAVLRAFGFPRTSLAWIVIAENAWLLVIGLGAGGIAATIALIPVLGESAARVPLGSLLATVALVLVTGMVASTVAAFKALHTPLLPSLKLES